MKPFYEDEYIQIYHGNNAAILPTLQGIGSIITDPPYGIGADKKNAHSSIRDNDQWENVNWDAIRPGKEMFDLMLSKANTCMFWGGNFFADMLPASSGWLIWRKPEAETGFSLADAELCWTNSNGAIRSITLPRRDGNLHPTQKPVALMRWCIQQVKEPGLICDPFMGSGTTLVAAKEFGLKAIGIERKELYCEIAAKRVADVTIMHPSLRGNPTMPIKRTEQARLFTQD